MLRQEKLGILSSTFLCISRQVLSRRAIKHQGASNLFNPKRGLFEFMATERYGFLRKRLEYFCLAWGGVACVMKGNSLDVSIVPVHVGITYGGGRGYGIGRDTTVVPLPFHRRREGHPHGWHGSQLWYRCCRDDDLEALLCQTPRWRTCPRAMWFRVI